MMRAYMNTQLNNYRELSRGVLYCALVKINRIKKLNYNVHVLVEIEGKGRQTLLQ